MLELYPFRISKPIFAGHPDHADEPIARLVGVAIAPTQTLFK